MPTLCNLERVRALLTHHLHALWAHPEQARVLPPLMLWGAPGIGKSTVVRELCEQEGIGFIDVRLAQREPIDIRGLPVPRDDGMHWLLPAEWPRDPDSRGIILFDELTAADRTLQVAAYEFILDRRLGDLYTVPDGWYLLGAGNRTGDQAVATTMSSALANRFLHLEVEADLETWVRWGRGRNIHPDVVGFLRFRPACFFDMDGNLERGWPSPRTWERVSLELQLGQALDDGVMEIVVAGLVGEAAAGEFLAFRSWQTDLADVREVLAGRAAITIPEAADQRYALCAAVAYHVWQMPDRDAVLERFFDISVALPSSFAAMLMVDATNSGGAEEALRLLGHPRFGEWSARHGEAFTSRMSAEGDSLVRAALRGLD